MVNVNNKVEKLIAFLKEEEEGLCDLLTIAKSQGEAIKAKDRAKIKASLKEREKIGGRIESLYKERIETEEGLGVSPSEGVRIEELKEGIARIVKEIIECDESNTQEMKKMMDMIKENLSAIEKARFLKEAYSGGTRGRGRKSIFINKHQ